VRRKKTPPAFRVGDDLGIDWERWADGRPFRLTRNRHYPDADPAVVRADAVAAAKRMGKVVVTVRDRFIPRKYVWVQFADYRVGPGQPCPCGSRRLVRVHVNYLKCPECGAKLLLSDEVEADDEQESRATQKLRTLMGVHLERRPGSEEFDHYRGYALKDGLPVLVWANFRLKPTEERIAQKDVFERVATVQTVPFTELSELFDADHPDVSSLWNGNEPEWDFVWEGGEELEPDDEDLSAG
jgi:DNA-directed RNA polymerase subunit RPC12/RpoP